MLNRVIKTSAHLSNIVTGGKKVSPRRGGVRQPNSMVSVEKCPHLFDF